MKYQFHISDLAARKILAALIIFEILLASIFLAHEILGHTSSFLYKMFDLDSEKNIPAIFSSLQLLMVGIVFLSMGYQVNKNNFLPAPFLIVLGVAFIYLSFDEAFSIHESITKSLVHIEWIPRFKGNHGIWIVPYLIICLTILLIMNREILLLWSKFRRETNLLVSGFLIFLIGVVVLEIISYQDIRGSNIYFLEVIVEESLEMIGVSIVLYGALLLRTRLLTAR